MSKIRYIRAPKDLSPQLIGFYERVARQLGVDPSYVSLVARGERQSALVEDALGRELIRIVEHRDKAPSHHEVQFYSDDAVFLEGFTRFISAALEAGDVAIVVATESHRDNLVEKLKAQGLDMDAAIWQGTYISLDAAKTLSTFMVNDMPDSARFFEVVGGLITKAAKAGKREHSRIVACGECAPLLWAEGKANAAIRLEQLCHQLGRTYGIDILCGYRLSDFHGEKDEHVFQSICREHSAIYSQGL
jgi:hypothetical protein